MAETPYMLTRLKKKMTPTSIQSRKNSQHQMGRDKYMIFRGSKENFVRNGAWLLEESIALFHGKANPVRHLSVVDLNNMNVERLSGYRERFYEWYQGIWEGRVVLVKECFYLNSHHAESFLREIVIATQMATHDNAHKILGSCLETECPVVVYEWMPPENLHDRIFLNDVNQSKAVLEWKDRLRIAWEISHVVAYLHTAFPRPIIHKNLKPTVVILDQNNAAKLGDFSRSISIPEGKEFVEIDHFAGTFGYIDPQIHISLKVAKSTDVYSFGMLLLVILTGKSPDVYSREEAYTDTDCFRTWALNRIKNDCVNEIVDPAITRNGVTSIEDLQQRVFAQLALRCTSEADYRPTMVEVATELKNMITSPEFIPTATNFQENGLYWIFRGREEYIMHNETWLLKENISLFHDSAHPIRRYFSIHELNNMNVELGEVARYCYRGTWEGKAVLVKLSSYSDGIQRSFVREIVVATKMVTHNNVHKLLGCCLETKLPVLVYELVAVETLEDRILLKDKNHSKLSPLEWKDRLRIAWEISDVVSYLHTAFSKPIIHGSLEPKNVFLDQDNTVKLSNFFYSASKGDKGESFAYHTRSSCYLEPECYYRALAECADLAPECYCRALAECADVYSFGMLFLVLLTGKKAFFLSTGRGEQYDESTNLVDWITKKVRLGHINEIVDPAIAKNGVANTELSASIELALRCTTSLLNSRPTMVDIATELNNIIRSHDSIPSTSIFQGEGIYMIFQGSKDYYMNNESFIVEERNSLFPGRAHPIRYFSVDEICKMKVEYHRIFWNEDGDWHQGSWEGNVVLVKLPKTVASDEKRIRLLREILVATQMASHSNVQKLIGCCLETEYPVLVYEWVAEETLQDRILFNDENQTKPVLGWKERLRIAWEISHVVSHLHNAFSRPIIHGYLETDSIFLDLDNTVKLSNFSRCISIPEGQNFVRDFKRYSYYMEHEKDDECVRVAECTDVYSFGIIFLVLLTGKSALFKNTKYGRTHLINWVTAKFPKVGISDIVDPAIAKNGVVNAEITAAIQLALKCTTKGDKRPTMVQVATQLEKIIRSSDLPNNCFSLLRGFLTS